MIMIRYHFFLNMILACVCVSSDLTAEWMTVRLGNLSSKVLDGCSSTSNSSSVWETYVVSKITSVTKDTSTSYNQLISHIRKLVVTVVSHSHTIFLCLSRILTCL